MAFRANRAFKLTLLGVVVLGLAGWVGVRAYTMHTAEGPGFDPGPRAEVVKIGAQKCGGDVLAGEDLVIDQIPIRFLPPNFVSKEDLPEVVGMVVSHESCLEEDSMLLFSDLATAEEMEAIRARGHSAPRVDIVH